MEEKRAEVFIGEAREERRQGGGPATGGVLSVTDEAGVSGVDQFAGGDVFWRGRPGGGGSGEVAGSSLKRGWGGAGGWRPV